MNRELLRQAVDALHGVYTAENDNEVAAAIAALEAELAKPEQDHGFDRTASHMVGEYVDNAEQKPVDRSWLSTGNPANAPLRITGAPPRKEWQCLTDEEIAKSWAWAQKSSPYGVTRIEIFAKSIEAKLKEKNT